MNASNEVVLRDRRILVVSPHPDDETFGCAGLIAKAKLLGSHVSVMVISAPESLQHFSREHPEVRGTTRIEELGQAMKVLGVDEHCVLFTDDAVHLRLDAMSQLDLIRLIERDGLLSIEKVRPDIICFPAASYNQDHRAVFDAVISACRPHLPTDKAFVPLILSYDQPQLSWSPVRFCPNFYVDISPYLEIKLRAYSCYHTQLRPAPHHASLLNVKRLAQLRGSEVSVEAAEAFFCHRLVA